MRTPHLPQIVLPCANSFQTAIGAFCFREYGRESHPSEIAPGTGQSPFFHKKQKPSRRKQAFCRRVSMQYNCFCSEKTGVPGFSGFINSKDHFQRRPAGGHIRHQGRIVQNSIYQILYLRHMAGACNGPRIGGGYVLGVFPYGNTAGEWADPSGEWNPPP